VNKLTIKFLKLCKKAGYTRIAISVRDGRIREFRNWPFSYENNVFAYPDICCKNGFMNLPKIWEIVEKLGLWNGCGNGQQAQIKPNKLTPGSYNLKDFKEK